MTQIFGEDGMVIPVTVVKTSPGFVTQVKTKERDGYEALQVGFNEQKAQRVNKAMAGHFKKAGTAAFSTLLEFDVDELGEYKAGDTINCNEVFNAGDFVDVTARGKGKGFTGVMKRWGFSGGPGGHGSMHNRGPGSIGQASNPSKVFKGIKMAGHKGNKTITTQNLKVVGIKAEENILLVKGSVPGPINGTIVIKKALKK